jgi:deoxyuridine 5'-triphosphate nucleotidohydrolase
MLTVHYENDQFIGYGSTDAAAFDIALPEFISIGALSYTTVSLKIAFRLPEGYCLLLYPRSSTFSRHGLLCPTSIIDWDYRGPIHGQMFNMDNHKKVFSEGTKLFQAMVVPYTQARLLSSTIDINTNRGINGLGSTGE